MTIPVQRVREEMLRDERWRVRKRAAVFAALFAASATVFGLGCWAFIRVVLRFT